MGLLKRIHVDMHIIRRNRKRDRGELEGEHEPPITVQVQRKPRKAFRVECEGPVTFIYQPEKPLSCGARLWAETKGPVCVDGEKIS